MPTPLQPPTNPKILKVIVRNRQKAVYDDEAVFVQSINEKGDFAVLGEHTNFISIIKKELIIGKADNNHNKIELTEQAVLKVNNNIVEVYLGLTEEGEKGTKKTTSPQGPNPTAPTSNAHPTEPTPNK